MTLTARFRPAAPFQGVVSLSLLALLALRALLISPLGGPVI